MNRIDQLFQELKAAKKKAFIAFITAGDPNLKTTKELVLAFEKKGVDLIELGVPFSDPLADGPTIQASSQRALKKGTTLVKILDCVKEIRKHSKVPIVLMTYYNPVFHFGEETFVKKAVQSGVDGVIIPDLPPEEAVSFMSVARKNQLSTIFFVSPTTKEERIKKIVKASTGFIYYVSLTGVTGTRKALPSSFRQQLKVIRKYTKKPICVGFGVSNESQVKDVAKVADGVIVGSAIVKELSRTKDKDKVIQHISNYVSRLARGTRRH